MTIVDDGGSQAIAHGEADVAEAALAAPAAATDQPTVTKNEATIFPVPVFGKPTDFDAAAPRP